MPQAIKENIIKYRLAIFYGVLFSFNALASAITASFLNVEWDSLSGTSKFLLIIVVAQNWTGTMLAFMSKTIARLDQGLDPVPPPSDMQPEPKPETPKQTEPNEKVPS